MEARETKATDLVVKIQPRRARLLARETVRLIDLPEGADKASAGQGVTLELAGLERFPVTWDGDPSSDELVELLSASVAGGR